MYTITRMNVTVHSAVLRSYRTNRNITVQRLSELTGIDVELLEAREEAAGEFALRDLESLAKAMKISWLAFLSSEPEKKRVFGNDNRSKYNQKESLDVEIQKVMEDTVYLLEVSEELAPDTHFDLNGFKADNGSPEQTAMSLRKYLSASTAAVMNLDNEYAVWKYWKELFSEKGLYIFERSWTITSVRAFSIRRQKKAAAVVSTKDVPLGRSFSLMHEVYHLINRQESICDMHFGQRANDIEVMSNRFAAAFLMPEEEFEAESARIGLQRSNVDEVDEKQVKKLQKTFRTSRLSIYRRLLTLGYISTLKYESIQQEYEGFEKPAHKRSGGSRDIYFRTRLNGVGTRYASELFTAHAEGRLTTLNMANILGVRVNQLPTITNLMGGGYGTDS